MAPDTPSGSNRSDEDLVAKALAQARGARGTGHAASLDAASVRIPGYTVLSEIHRGGQGVVYKAVQDGTRRTVAIKLMLRGAFSGDRERARFEREIRVLSQIRHPGIVSIYESGEVDGRVFHVMEYVSGKPLDEYLRQSKPGLRSALELFARICEAVHAAHLQGVIHRDLKPDNIRIDASGSPHILDFGLAKVAGSIPENEAGQPVMMTMTGQFIGSLPWASPEQAEGIASRIDIRTDVYSLGVVLYQMLTGRFPYAVEGTTREVLTSIAEAPAQRPRSLDRQIPSEVETITMRALAKDRDRRYQSAGELAGDIRRHLGGQPILARSDSLSYVLRKTLARHRLAATTILIVLLVITGFGAGMTVLWNLASTRGDDLEVALQQRDADLDFVLDVIFGADGHRQFARDRTVQDVVQDLSQSADDRFADDPIRRATLHEMLGRAYRSFQHPQTARGHFERSLALRVQHLGPDHDLTLGSQNSLAETLKDLGAFADAAAHYAEIERALVSATVTDAASRRRLASTLSNRARLLEQLDRCVEAHTVMEQAVSVLASDLDDQISARLHLLAQGHLAGIKASLGRYRAASSAMSRIQQQIASSFGPNHPATATGAIKLAQILIEAGENDAARDHLEASRSIMRTPTPEWVRTDAYAVAYREGFLAGAQRLDSAGNGDHVRLVRAELLQLAGDGEGARRIAGDLLAAADDRIRHKAAVMLAELDLDASATNPETIALARSLADDLFGKESPASLYAAALDAAHGAQTPAEHRLALAQIRSLRDRIAEVAGETHRLTRRADLLCLRGYLLANEAGDSDRLQARLLEWSTAERGETHPLTRRLVSGRLP